MARFRPIGQLRVSEEIVAQLKQSILLGHFKPIVEAVLAGDGKAAAIEMGKHTVEFGETLIKMEKVYREKKSTLLF